MQPSTGKSVIVEATKKTFTSLCVHAQYVLDLCPLRTIILVIAAIIGDYR